MEASDIKAIHQRCLALFQTRRYAEAAELADTVSKVVGGDAAQPYHGYEMSWAFCEDLGKYEASRNPDRAFRLYQMAIRTYESISTGQISDSYEVVPHVRRIRARIQMLQGVNRSDFFADMVNLRIDSTNGDLYLPDGNYFWRDVTNSKFEKMDIAKRAVSINNAGKQGFRFMAGTVDEKPVHVTLYFGRWFWLNLLRRVEFYISLYESESTRLEATSLETEIQMKAIHDTLLRRSLGKPHIVHTASGDPYLPDFPLEVIYNYPWGTVTSSYERKNMANVHITIQYKGL